MEIIDVMRFCIGDGPAVELESGQQRGGHYFCAAGCGVHADRIYELDHTFRCRVANYEERRNTVLKGPIGRRLSFALHPRPLQNLN